MDASTGGQVCTPVAVGAQTEGPVERVFTPLTPNLGVQIPGADLPIPTQEGDHVVIAFLGQYINAIYRYAVSIVLIVAIIMVVYGGFRYLVGASLGDIQAGKKIIVDALVGMLIVLGAYMLLNTVNPSTVTFRPLSLVAADRVDIDAELRTTTVDTIGPDEEGTTGGGSSTYVSERTRSGAPTPSYTECPVTLSTPAPENPRTSQARRAEFIERMSSVATGATARLRVLQYAEAAAKCGVWWASCGATAEAIYELAGSQPRGHQIHGEARDKRTSLLRAMHDNRCIPYNRDCNRNAKSVIYNKMQEDVPGWPRAWTDELEPGDVVSIYNANSSEHGMHRFVFMGWASAGQASVVQGANNTYVRTGTICITDECSHPSPVIRIFRPTDE